MDNPNTITYADDWKEAYSRVYNEKTDVDTEDIESPKKAEPAKSTSKPLLVIIQLIFFTIIVIVAFCIKAFGGDFYEQTRSLYYDNINDEIIMTDDFQNFSLDSLIADLESNDNGNTD